MIDRVLRNFHEILRQFRLTEGRTQNEVARAIGITYQSYQAYEHGISLPTLENFVRLCEYFEVTPNELFGIK